MRRVDRGESIGHPEQFEEAKRQKYLVILKGAHRTIKPAWISGYFLWCISQHIPYIRVRESRQGYARVTVDLPNSETFTHNILESVQKIANDLDILTMSQANERKYPMQQCYFYRQSERTLTTSFKLIPTNTAILFAKGIAQLLIQEESMQAQLATKVEQETSTAPSILEHHTSIEWISTNALNIDMTYQRALSPEKVKAISSKFNEAAAGTLIVSLRENGQYFIMDGQHRLAAMKKHGTLNYAECKVCRGLTIEQEAEIYIYCNTVRKQPEAIDVFRARLVTHDPVAIAIQNVVDQCGLSILFVYGRRNGKRLPNSIWAVTTLEEIYKRGKEKLLTEILTLAKRSWPDDGNAFEKKVLLGITDFHLKYQGRYDREEFVSRMNRVDLNFLSRRAQYHNEFGGASVYGAFSKSLQETYDKGRRNRRLENKD